MTHTCYQLPAWKTLTFSSRVTFRLHALCLQHACRYVHSLSARTDSCTAAAAAAAQTAAISEELQRI